MFVLISCSSVEEDGVNSKTILNKMKHLLLPSNLFYNFIVSSRRPLEKHSSDGRRTGSPPSV